MREDVLANLSQQRLRRLVLNLRLLWSNLTVGCRSRLSCLRAGLYFPKFLEYPLVRHHLGNIADKTVLDLGANYRYFTVWLATARQARIIAVDLLHQPLTLYRRLPFVQQHPQCILPCTATLTALPLSDATVDAVCCVSTIEHISNDTTVMQEIARVLKPGGRAVVSFPCAARGIVNPNPDFTQTRLYDEQDVRLRLFEPSGLRCDTIEWWQIADTTTDGREGYLRGILYSLFRYRRVASCVRMGSNALHTAVLVLSKPLPSDRQASH